MGEYAIDQMMLDFKRMTGIDAKRSDFESEKRTSKKPICPKCGKKFGAHIAVRDHMRDKHASQEQKP
jgi:hypothetical protein